MRLLPTTLIFALAFASATRSSAQESVDSKVCAQLLPAIERLEAMLVQEYANRTVSDSLLGLFPATLGSEEVDPRVNEIELLGTGDTLLIATDGLTDHGEGRFVAEELERRLDGVKEQPAAKVAATLRESILAFGPPTDDITFVAIKGT